MKLIDGKEIKDISPQLQLILDGVTCDAAANHFACKHVIQELTRLRAMIGEK